MPGLSPPSDPARASSMLDRVFDRVTIRQKGLIVVSAPVVFALALLALVAQLDGATQKAQTSTEHSMHVIAQGYQLRASFVEAESAARVAGIANDPAAPARFEAARRSIASQLVELRALVAGDPAQAARALALARSASTQLTALDRIVARRARTADALALPTAQLASFLSTESLLESRQLAASHALRNAGGWLLAGGALLSIALSLFSIALVERWALRRLRAVRAKAAQLESGSPLDSPLAGTDEIADLDRVIHRVARTIADRLEALNRYQLLMNRAQDIMYVFRRSDGRILEVNQAAVDAYGYDWDEFFALTVRDLRAPESADLLPQDLEKIDRDGVVLERMQRRKDGCAFPAEIASQAAEIRGERVVLSVVRDVTARRRVELALADARDQALQAYRMKSEFLANMSHEIRTPMTAVIGATELLLATTLSGEQREYVELLRKSADGMLAILNDILDFSKLEAGKTEIGEAEFSLGPLVEGTADLLAPQAASKKLSLMTFVDPRIPKLVRGDAAKVRQILLNLGANAVKFTERGGVLIRVLADAPREDDIVCRFEVSDSGVGVPPAERGRLFEPFMQVNGSATRRFGGTGLGLAICKRLATLMGGAIGIDTGEGGGSTFWFTVRLRRAAVELVRPQTDSVLSLTKALVVDGDPSARAIVAKYLAAWGVAVEAVADIPAALEALRRCGTSGEPFDVVIVDQGDGGVLQNRLGRALRDEPNVPMPHIILLAPFDATGKAESAFAAGFASLVTKPVRQSQLFDAIASVMQRSNYRPIAFLDRSQSPGPYPRAKADGIQLLVAEDNPINQRLALRQLQKLGFAVRAANNGLEAVEAFTVGGLSLIFMDCQMPELDGFEATRIIRKFEARNGGHIPIIAMTANAMEGDRDACVAAGMDDYLSKPVRLESLRQAVARWVEGRDEQVPVATHDAIDLSRLREIFGDDPAGIDDMLKLACESLQSNVTRCRSAIDHGDLHALALLAHELKGSCANIGADDMARISVRIEEAIADLNFDAASDLVRDLAVAFGRMREYVASLTAPGAPSEKHADHTLR